MTAFIAWLMQGFVEARSLGGEVLTSRFAFELSSIRAPEPDVAYVGPGRIHLLEESRMRVGPDVAVQIVSRESRNRD